MVVLHRVPASGSFGAFWFVRSGGCGCRLWFGSLLALSEWPDDDCGGLTQAAPKQHLDAAGMESIIFPVFAPNVAAETIEHTFFDAFLTARRSHG